MTNDELRILHQALLYKLQLKKKEFAPSENYHYEGLIPYHLDIWGPLMLPKAILVHFGIIIIHFPDLALSPKLINSKYAKVIAYQKAMEKIEAGEELMNHIETHYKKDFEERICDALKAGEEMVEYQQIVRELSRKQALEFSISFHVVDDLYVYACKEFASRAASLLKLRPSLLESLEKNFGSLKKYRKSKAAKIIRDISDRFYAVRLKGKA